MTDLRVLTHFGCTNERLREIFTAKNCGEPLKDDATDAQKAACEKQAKDHKIRKKFEDEIRSNMLEGVATNARNSRPCQAVDMAWDAPPISRETVPLLLWAMGKIDVPRLWDVLEGEVGSTTAATFLKKDPTSGQLLKPTVPRICDVKIDLVRSYITRRLAGMDALWANQWPLFRYDPRGAEAVAQLRGDALTQRVDIMSDAYNYRHLGTQCRRDMLMYGQSIVFPRSSWDRQIGWRFKTTNTGEPTEEVESYVTREGLDLINPHPNRVAYDLSAPLANINTDTGPKWIFYWDITRFRNLYDDGAKYFNLDQIWFSENWTQLTAMYPEFFGYYFDPCVLAWPDINGSDPTLGNDRSARIGVYASEWRDKGILVLPYFKKINPKVEGIGDYDAEVWVKLTVAGDNTIIAAEFMPSLPAVYGAINWNDNKVANQSMGMALLGYQDQASNILSHMLQQIRTSLVQLWLLDTDSLDPEVIKELEKNAANANWWVDAKVLKYSAKKLSELGIQDPKQAFAVIQANVQNVVQSGLAALGQLLNLADRLLILSPNELGQPNPREVAAREVQEIANSVQSITAFNNEGPREQTAALKELIYESLICCASEVVTVPIEGRYTLATIKKAGFTAPDMTEEEQDNQVVPVRTRIMGSLRNLRYDYYFDSRDGAERPQNTQGAQVIQQLLGPLIQDPEIRAALGKKRIFDIINTIIRMSGAPINTQIQIADGEEDAIPAPPPAQSAPQQGGPSASAAGTDARIARLEQIIMEMARAQGQMPSGGGPQQAGQPPAAPSPTQTLAPPMGA